ncbi:MAG TPA: NAD(P)H-binding protein [Gaiellaceae bacterium]|nr:NAD(P)H-binding protein [Gaiellaceae bacterium]
MRVLVTGATGFVGPKVANAIADAGHELRVLERKPGAWAEAGIRCQSAVQGDMTDAESLRRAVAAMEVVVHLVAIRQGSAEQFQRVMIEGTRNLIAAAKDAGVRRFVLMSALGTNEQTKDLVPFFNAKWTQEQDVKASGLEHVIVRPTFIFGRDGGILATFMKIARLAPVTGIIGSGKQRIQPIWVDDVGAYFAAAIDTTEAADRTFEIGGPDVVTWNELWRRIRAVLGIRRRPTLHLPTGLMRIPATVTERLPGNIPLTRDLLTMLEVGDNVVTNDDAVRTFELPLVPLDEQLRRARGS